MRTRQTPDLEPSIATQSALIPDENLANLRRNLRRNLRSLGLGGVLLAAGLMVFPSRCRMSASSASYLAQRPTCSCGYSAEGVAVDGGCSGWRAQVEQQAGHSQTTALHNQCQSDSSGRCHRRVDGKPATSLPPPAPLSLDAGGRSALDGVDTEVGMLSGISRKRSLCSNPYWFTEFCNSQCVSHFAITAPPKEGAGGGRGRPAGELSGGDASSQ